MAHVEDKKRSDSCYKKVIIFPNFEMLPQVPNDNVVHTYTHIPSTTNITCRFIQTYLLVGHPYSIGMWLGEHHITNTITTCIKHETELHLQ